MKGEDGDGSDGYDYSQKHESDEPGGPIGRFWGGLGDAEGVNEDICEI